MAEFGNHQERLALLFRLIRQLSAEDQESLTIELCREHPWLISEPDNPAEPDPPSSSRF